MTKFTTDVKTIQKSFNSTWEYICRSAEAIENENYQELSNLPQYLRWSLLSPGAILASAYIYFVIGRESQLLDNFPEKDEEKVEFIRKFNIEQASPNFNTKTNLSKCQYIIRRLRNAISHGNVSYEDKNQEGRQPVDGNRYFKFYDNNKNNNDPWLVSIRITDFGNIVEQAGCVCFNYHRETT